MHSSGEPTSAELSAMLRAARTVGRTQVARRTGVAAIALLATFAASAAISTEFSGFHHAGAPSAFLTPRGEIVRPRDGTPHEEIKMRGFNGVMAGAALALSSSVLAQDAVQWRVEDGGNGHWYQGVRLSASSSVGFNNARFHAIAQGADLVSLTTAGESDWVFERVARDPMLWSVTFGPWVGASQESGVGEPGSGWKWLDGTPVDPSFWSSCCFQPDNATYCGDNEAFACYWFGEGDPSPANRFADLVETGYCVVRETGDWVASAVFEWSADCNSDGIVDYGQIRSGELDDANTNNIPDCCEQGIACGCAADVDSSGAVNGVDLAAILNVWGTSGGKYPTADINGDGTVNATDLAAVLNAWGPCS